MANIGKFFYRLVIRWQILCLVVLVYLAAIKPIESKSAVMAINILFVISVIAIFGNRYLLKLYDVFRSRISRKS